MAGFEVTGPYVSALLMSLGALCAFIWGVLSGAFHDADEAALRFYQMEMESDGDHAKQADE
jgi:cbb3-type cytochrome oxidase maturation protein